jgi:hypothetical protein
MKTYNRALDNMALAANHYLEGNEIVAAAFFMKAAQSPDVAQAIAIIEASNAQAYAAASVKTEATAKAPVKASKKQITASERKQLAALVGADVVNAEFGEEPVGEPEAVEDEAVEVEDEQPSFAQALAALKKSQK